MNANKNAQLSDKKRELDDSLYLFDSIRSYFSFNLAMMSSIPSIQSLPIIFLGTPDFAVASLKALVDHQIKCSGRGNRTG